MYIFKNLDTVYMKVSKISGVHIFFLYLKNAFHIV